MTDDTPRYVVKHYSEAVALGWQTCGAPDDAFLLFDTATDPPTFIDSEGGEPGEQKFIHDWSWVPELLNEHAAREAKLRKALENSVENESCVCGILSAYMTKRCWVCVARDALRFKA